PALSLYALSLHDALPISAAALGSAGFLGFLSMVPKSIPMWALSVAISFIVAFALTFIYGKRHFKEDVAEESGTVESAGDQVAQQDRKSTRLTPVTFRSRM